MNGPRPWKMLLVLTLLCLWGCGPKTGDVKGTVTCQGKTVKVGTVTFFGADGVPHASVLDDEGNFHVKGLPTGKAKVIVASPSPNSAQVVSRSKEKVTPDPQLLKKWFPIPEKYADISRTELQWTVVGGQNTVTLELK